MVKRKDYKTRIPVLLSAEKHVWEDFQELCDKERKSTSLMFNELMEWRLRKNGIGDVRSPTDGDYNISTNKDCTQSLLTEFIGLSYTEIDQLVSGLNNRRYEEAVMTCKNFRESIIKRNNGNNRIPMKGGTCHMPI